MHKIRQILVLHKIPVKYYSRSSNRQFVIESFYEILMNETEDPSIIYNDFIRKIELLIKLKGIFCKYEIEYNKLISECLIWALYICDVENIDIPQFEAEEPFYNDLLIYVKQDLDKFSNLESHFYKSYEPRYEYILKFVENKFNKNLVDTYITSHRDVVKNRQKIDSDINITKQLDELKELRIDKAELQAPQ